MCRFSIGLVFALYCGVVSATIATTRYKKTCSSNDPGASTSREAARKKWRCLSECTSAGDDCRGVTFRHDDENPCGAGIDDCSMPATSVYIKRDYLPGACSENSQYEASLQACYQVISLTPQDNVHAARAACPSRLGNKNYHLVAITSAAEQDFIRSLVTGTGCDYVWTAGYTDTPGTSPMAGWYWYFDASHSEMLSMAQEGGQTFWGPNEPNNVRQGQNALILIVNANYDWVDFEDDPSNFASNSFCAICELN